MVKIMSSFIEFQAIVMDKLCSIENRLDTIENLLGVRYEKNDENICEKSETERCSDESQNSFISEINEFHNELANLKTIFSASKI